jgi:hypothetical protein
MVSGLSFSILRRKLSGKKPVSLTRNMRLRGARLMEFEAIKAAVMNLDEGQQRRVVLELLPAIWPHIAADEACLKLIKKLIDAESVKRYQEEHLDHI